MIQYFNAFSNGDEIRVVGAFQKSSGTKNLVQKSYDFVSYFDQKTVLSFLSSLSYLSVRLVKPTLKK